MNILDLCPIFINEELAFNFAVNNGMLYQNIKCTNCFCDMSLIQDFSYKWNYIWRCPACRCKASIFCESVFSYSKLPCNKVLYLIYCWVNGYNCQDAAHEVKVDKNTVTFYYKQFRSACISYLVNQPKQLIGGPGFTVEIDETLMCRRKYNRGRELCHIWIFGGICRETKEVFAHVVDDRSANTLWDFIIQSIAPGTKIISDCWKAYNLIDQQPHPQMFLHQTVNHSQNFVDPVTGAHTQHIERLWRELKRINQKYEGIPESQIASHLAEFIFRRNEIKNNDPWNVAINLVRNTTFYPQGDTDD